MVECVQKIHKIQVFHFLSPVTSPPVVVVVTVNCLVFTFCVEIYEAGCPLLTISTWGPGHLPIRGIEPLLNACSSSLSLVPWL